MALTDDTTAAHRDKLLIIETDKSVVNLQRKTQKYILHQCND